MFSTHRGGGAIMQQEVPVPAKSAPPVLDRATLSPDTAAQDHKDAQAAVQPIGSQEWLIARLLLAATQPLKPSLKQSGSRSSLHGSKASSRSVSIKAKKRWADNASAEDESAMEETAGHFSNPDLAKQIAADIQLYQTKAESDPAFQQMVTTLRGHLQALIIPSTEVKQPEVEVVKA